MGIYIGDTPILSSSGGKSPYEVAKENGYTGTEAEFNAALVEIDEEVTPASIGAYTQEEVDNMLQEKQNVIDGLEKQLASRPNPNLLDNWYFGNPVNQRGLASGQLWGESSYGLDRWYTLYNNAVYWDSNGYVCFPGNVMNCIIEQKTEQNLIGKTVTISALTDDNRLFSVTGVVPFSAYDGAFQIAFVEETNSFRYWWLGTADIHVTAVGAELGTEQTLAHQDADGNWVLNEIPDYGEQLAKCQRYYRVFKSSHPFSTFGGGLVSAVHAVEVTIIFPVPMRVAPAFTALGGFTSNSDSFSGVTEVVQLYSSQTGSTLRVAVSGDFVVGNYATLQGDGDNNSTLIFDADL